MRARLTRLAVMCIIVLYAFLCGASIYLIGS